MSENNPFIDLKCPHCGSSEIEFSSRDTIHCLSCGSKYQIRQPKQTIVNNITVNLKAKEGHDLPSINYYEMKGNDASKIKRDYIIRLANLEDTPASLFNFEFKDLSFDYRYFIRGVAECELNYSVRLGYNRNEQYVDEERQWSGNNVRDIPVIHERTVTDWRPQVGSVKQEGSYVTEILFDESAQGLKELNYYISKYYKDRYEELVLRGANSLNYPVPTTEDYKDLEDLCAYNAMNRLLNTFAANKTQNLNYSHEAYFTNIDIIAVPTYKMTIAYNNNDYCVEGLSNGEFTYKKEPISFNLTSERQCISKINEKVKKKRIGAFLAVFFTTFACYLTTTTFMGMMFSNFDSQYEGLYVLFFFIFLLASILSSIIGWGSFKKASDTYYQKALKEQLDKYTIDKINAVNNFLSNNNLEPLTDEEKKKITFKIE